MIKKSLSLNKNEYRISKISSRTLRFPVGLSQQQQQQQQQKKKKKSYRRFSFGIVWYRLVPFL